MRLPKVLAIATVAVMAAGSVTATAMGASGPSRRSAAVRISGTVRAATDPSRAPATAATDPGTTPTSPTSGAAGAATVSAGAGDGLSVPASGVPVSSGLDPAGGTSGPGRASPGAPVQLPTPIAGSLPQVQPLSSVSGPDAVVMLPSSLTAAEQLALPSLRGIKAVETVDTGTVQLGGAPVVAFGVDPGSFRSFTPAASATSDQLWQYLAAGSLVSSYEMANDRSLRLGAQTQIIPAATSAPTVQGWLGAFASIGLPGVDLLVAEPYSADLHLAPNSGLVVSAPGVPGAVLQHELEISLPGAAVELLHTTQVPQSIPGSLLDSGVRQKIITAALTRVGLPYVWGAVGADSFDCSGLVQWAYRQVGVLMPRVAAQQFLTGDHIPLAAAQPGDLLFWTYDPNDPGYVDHVAIYLGNGLMVVAPHTGTNVQVTTVPTDNFAGAVEVVLRSA